MRLQVALREPVRMGVGEEERLRDGEAVGPDGLGDAEQVEAEPVGLSDAEGDAVGDWVVVARRVGLGLWVGLWLCDGREGVPVPVPDSDCERDRLGVRMQVWVAVHDWVRGGVRLRVGLVVTVEWLHEARLGVGVGDASRLRVPVHDGGLGVNVKEAEGEPVREGLRDRDAAEGDWVVAVQEGLRLGGLGVWGVVRVRVREAVGVGVWEAGEGVALRLGVGDGVGVRDPGAVKEPLGLKDRDREAEAVAEVLWLRVAAGVRETVTLGEAVGEGEGLWEGLRVALRLSEGRDGVTVGVTVEYVAEGLAEREAEGVGLRGREMERERVAVVGVDVAVALWLRDAVRVTSLVGLRVGVGGVQEGVLVCVREAVGEYVGTSERVAVWLRVTVRGVEPESEVEGDSEGVLHVTVGVVLDVLLADGD